ncbi:hypothetical protein HGG63_07460 [Alteromonadaceae bacterium A_SAG1]|nr:hypothetical protein [Alteromonadaceae bacterium A_SAG1]
MEEVFAFADESGKSKGCPCYTIRIIAIPKNYFAEFNQKVSDIYDRSVHGRSISDFRDHRPLIKHKYSKS